MANDRNASGHGHECAVAFLYPDDAHNEASCLALTFDGGYYRDYFDVECLAIRSE